MRQLLIVAIETEDALDIDHLSIQVPRLIQNARGRGAIINDSFKPKEIVEVAKACVEALDDPNVPIHLEPTAGQVIEAGFRQTMAILDRHEKLIQENARYQAGFLNRLFGK